MDVNIILFLFQYLSIAKYSSHDMAIDSIF